MSIQIQKLLLENKALEKFIKQNHTWDIITLEESAPEVIQMYLRTAADVIYYEKT